MKMLEKNGLKISSDLYEFINSEAIPGTNIKNDEFWDNFSKIVHELSPINRTLIQKRDKIQEQIDNWHNRKKGKNLTKLNT